MNSNQINMISNNINGIHSTKKRFKMIQYFKNKVLPLRQGILFLQETHSTESDEASCRDEFNGTLFFSHESSNSCRVLISSFGRFDVNVLNQMCDNKGHILILDSRCEHITGDVNIYLYWCVSLLAHECPVCLCVCVFVCVISNQSTSKKSRVRPQ